jgi:hypothetical protein
MFVAVYPSVLALSREVPSTAAIERDTPRPQLAELGLIVDADVSSTLPSIEPVGTSVMNDSEGDPIRRP